MRHSTIYLLLNNTINILLPILVYSQKPQETLNLLVTEDCYWALFYMPLYMSLHNLLNVLVQIANKMGFKKIGVELITS
jgi:hypothetical protein